MKKVSLTVFAVCFMLTAAADTAFSAFTWTARDSNRNWKSVASSADGTKLAVVWRGRDRFIPQTILGLIGRQQAAAMGGILSPLLLTEQNLRRLCMADRFIPQQIQGLHGRQKTATETGGLSPLLLTEQNLRRLRVADIFIPQPIQGLHGRQRQKTATETGGLSLLLLTEQNLRRLRMTDIFITQLATYKPSDSGKSEFSRKLPFFHF